MLKLNDVGGWWNTKHTIGACMCQLHDVPTYIPVHHAVGTCHVMYVCADDDAAAKFFRNCPGFDYVPINAHSHHHTPVKYRP